MSRIGAFGGERYFDANLQAKIKRKNAVTMKYQKELDALHESHGLRVTPNFESSFRLGFLSLHPIFWSLPIALAYLFHTFLTLTR